MRIWNNEKSGKLFPNTTDPANREQIITKNTVLFTRTRVTRTAGIASSNNSAPAKNISQL